MNWDGFDDYISLYDESSLCYGGAHWVDSEWGYRAYTQADWASAYKATEGASPLSGNLVFAESDGNIPAPEKGLYVMDFNMKELTYMLTKIESVTFTGLNDDWSEHPMIQSTEIQKYSLLNLSRKKRLLGVSKFSSIMIGGYSSAEETETCASDIQMPLPVLMEIMPLQLEKHISSQ